jgi:hypothetical protein
MLSAPPAAANGLRRIVAGMAPVAGARRESSAPAQRAAAWPMAGFDSVCRIHL